MIKLTSSLLLSSMFVFGSAYASEKLPTTINKVSEVKLSQECLQKAKTSITKGVNYLISKQHEDGSWAKHPAITSLVVMSIANSDDATSLAAKEAIAKGMKYILSHVQEDGSIWNKNSREFPSYSTSVCLITIAYFNNPEYKNIIKNAREFLMSSQFSEDEKDVNFGGFGYGKNMRADVSVTSYVLEALHVTEDIDSGDVEATKKSNAMWERANKFLTRCQHLADSNDQGWVVSDESQKGSFVYVPTVPSGKAGEVNSKGQKVTLRGYGSMTYAGLKSMIYAKMDKNDNRIKQAYNWITRNYTLDENPGQGAQGLYYYYQTFTKALSLMEKDELITSDGKKHIWREDLVQKVVLSQQTDGSWFNKEGRWWESMPELVTSYSLLSLEQAIMPTTSKNK